MVQDTWCEPSWFNRRLLLPKDDKKEHFLEFFGSSGAASPGGPLANGGPLARGPSMDWFMVSLQRRSVAP